jgi:hypothetical protein
MWPQMSLRLMCPSSWTFKVATFRIFFALLHNYRFSFLCCLLSLVHSLSITLSRTHSHSYTRTHAHAHAHAHCTSSLAFSLTPSHSLTRANVHPHQCTHICVHSCKSSSLFCFSGESQPALCPICRSEVQSMLRVFDWGIQSFKPLRCGRVIGRKRDIPFLQALNEVSKYNSGKNN